MEWSPSPPPKSFWICYSKNAAPIKFRNRKRLALYNAGMTTPGRGATIARTVAAFFLNLIAAILGPVMLGGEIFQRLVRTLFPSLSSISFMAHRELLISVVFAAFAALCVSICWSTKTARWVWIVPLPMLLVRMVVFALGSHGSVMQDLDTSVHYYGFWEHFFKPDLSKGLREYTDFSVFTIGAVRATTYSLMAWLLPRWEWFKTHLLLAESGPNESEPTMPAMWTAPKLPWFSATNLLIGINVAVFVAMITSGVSACWPNTFRIKAWGGVDSSALHGEPWRLVTYSFLHWGILHLAGNMISLWWIGRVVERIFGPRVLTGIYLLTAIGAAAVRVASVDSLGVHAGASGAILGIAGFLLVAVFYGNLKPPSTQLFYRRMAVFGVLLLVSTFPGLVVNVVHLAGFVIGMALGLVFVKSLRVPSSHKMFAATQLFEAREAIERHEFESAIQQLQGYLDDHPSTADAHALLGYSFHALERFEDAANQYKLALSLGCAYPELSRNLATISASPDLPDEMKATAIGAKD